MYIFIYIIYVLFIVIFLVWGMPFCTWGIFEGVSGAVLGGSPFEPLPHQNKDQDQDQGKKNKSKTLERVLLFAKYRFSA